MVQTNSLGYISFNNIDEILMNIGAGPYSDTNAIFMQVQYDFEAAENVNYEANGYIYVSLLVNPVAINEETVDYYTPVDTTTMLMDEIPLVTSIEVSSSELIDNTLILTSLYEGKDKQENSYRLCFEYAEPRVDNGSGKNIYTLFLRAIKEIDGEKLTDTYAATNAYDVRNILRELSNREQALGNKDYFLLDVMYLKELDEEKNILTWDSPTAMVPCRIVTED
ncbi:hypothetical protein D0T51_01790 [Parabacteroides sp. 52]|nr:hypothetical protein [Parabacteroides sp. 52]